MNIVNIWKKKSEEVRVYHVISFTSLIVVLVTHSLVLEMPWNSGILIFIIAQCLIFPPLVFLTSFSVHDERRAIYYDAFSPKTQPEMWNINTLNKITNTLFPNGIIVTYCSQGQFRRNLKNLGLACQ